MPDANVSVNIHHMPATDCWTTVALKMKYSWLHGKPNKINWFLPPILISHFREKDMAVSGPAPQGKYRHQDRSIVFQEPRFVEYFRLVSSLAPVSSLIYPSPSNPSCLSFTCTYTCLKFQTFSCSFIFLNGNILLIKGYCIRIALDLYTVNG